MKFQYFTFFLNKTRQQQLLPDSRPKREIILSILKQSFQYKKGTSELGYVFIKQEGDFVIAKLGKKSTLKKSLPPDKKFEEYNEETWPHCYILINTSENPEIGQRVAFETKSIFSPVQQLKYFADELNSKLFVTGYAISINPITKEQEFWDLINTNKEQIQSLTFSYNAPNLFNTPNSLHKELKDLSERYGATRINIGLDNPDNRLIIPEDEFMKQSAEWVSRGGGEYTLKLKGKKFKKIVKSKDIIMSKEIDDMNINLKTSDKEILLQTLNKILL